MQNLVITNAGQELMTSLITKGTTASFTKIATSEHAYKKEELGNLLALEDIKQEVAISKLEQKDASTIEITAAITNEELTEGYYIKALGLYIKDNEGNEILYAVAIDDTPDHLSAFDNKTISSIKYRLNVRVSNSEQVTLEIDPKVYATAEQIEELSNSVSEISKSLQQVTEITTDLKSHAFNSLANNLTTTTTGYALDATQGKALNDKFGKVLWENPNPTSAITTMTINLSSSDYDVLDIYYTGTTTSNIITTESCLKGYDSVIIATGWGKYVSGEAIPIYICRRYFKRISDVQYTLGELDKNDDVYNNNNLIPLKIIGRKLS